MIRITLLTLILSAAGVCAQTAAPATAQDDCENSQNANNDECLAALAEAEGVTGFVPLIAPALGAAAAAAGLAAAAGGGSNPSTTSTVSTN